MMIPEGQERPQAQDPRGGTIIEIVANQQTILFRRHHQGFPDANAVPFINEFGVHILLKYFQKAVVFGKEVVGILMAGQRVLTSPAGEDVFNFGQEDIASGGRSEPGNEKAVILTGVTVQQGT
jgi:hypothetical protein